MSTSPPKRVVQNSRLVYYRQAANVDYWDKVWQNQFSANNYQKARQGDLGLYEQVVSRYLPRQGRILEAGCGAGHVVLALRQRGYNIQGVDWAETTVTMVKRLWPNLPLYVGDVRHLAVNDGTYTACISLGVAEHFQTGPEPILLEAHRILTPGGWLIISVPFFNALRRLKAKLGLYGGPVNGRQFYQYAFSTSEFTAIVEKCGFEIIAIHANDAAKGLKDELWFLRVLSSLHPKVAGVVWLLLNRFLEPRPWARHNLGHMQVIVARSLKVL